jgi:murein DD-endopeptidase MepM/ murein hydrolase activator NlpD
MITKENIQVSKPIKYRVSYPNVGYTTLQVLTGENQNIWKDSFNFVGQSGAGVTPINQRFGANGVPFYADLGLLGHNGIDWNAKHGTCLYSPIDGTVISFVDDKSDKGYGQNIDILSDEINADGKRYRFEVVEGHLMAEYVSLNQRVLRGQFIGLCDNTGKYTTGDHLHEGFRLLEPINQLQNNYTPHWYLSGWGYKNNGYLGYVDHEQLIDNIMIMSRFELANWEGKYIQLTDAPGGFYKVVNNEIIPLSSEKDPVTRHIPLVDEMIVRMNKEKLVKGVNQETLNRLLNV